MYKFHLFICSGNCYDSIEGKFSSYLGHFLLSLQRPA